MVLDHQERTHIKNILSIAIIDAVGSYGYTQYQEASHRAIEESLSDSERGPELSESSSQFTCDGRTHRSQMTSGAEATSFRSALPEH
jgi:hypothetical protein